MDEFGAENDEPWYMLPSDVASSASIWNSVSFTSRALGAPAWPSR